jgi:signal transduction histidine kinase
VFDRFYRRSAGDEDGTGLGLAIVRSVAERHGAELTLDDAPAGGLRVTLRFAADPAGKPAAPAPDAAAPARSEAASTP